MPQISIFVAENVEWASLNVDDVFFQLLRKCILNMTIPCVVPDGPLGVPPFEKPSIAKVDLIFLCFVTY